MTKLDLKQIIEVPEGTQVEINKFLVKIIGPQGTLEKNFVHPILKIKKAEEGLVIETKNATKREKRMMNTFAAHLRNMVKGVNESFEYRLKVCSGHFPMTVNLEGDKLIVKNFLGEKVPRKAKVWPNVKVDLKGNEITVSSIDLEAAGQTAANMESSTRITNRDRRVFQDGIYITKKPK
ncbi:MAG: 50S ribosomal protein L6 [Nanoarchaeota archaeon]|nr:50S ribosomal protein L6 [Nanoarchaeota archaeon]MBU1445025.1 50S ribosomal protein L6 [Nanoarchaeota archaeon]MBU2406434.1 50S ribosomal protein L6 [Nanoarchaeota archaeon]MBU2420035.1 50S ribosomal protein L6 [Nanoarchaeota archaeon]MBU2475485.1 50S ribosomal protein L6 [Nanoarchaeota archaeon]